MCTQNYRVSYTVTLPFQKSKKKYIFNHLLWYINQTLVVTKYHGSYILNEYVCIDIWLKDLDYI